MVPHARYEYSTLADDLSCPVQPPSLVLVRELCRTRILVPYCAVLTLQL